MLSLQTLKSIRKWRDRGFMLRARVRDRRRFPAGKRILFSPWPEVEQSIRYSFRGTRHHVAFGDVPPDGGDYDLVVPVSIAALLDAGRSEPLRRRNPLPIPSPAAIELCDDKAALNEWLQTHGMTRHLPAAPNPGVYPYMLKRRRDACARHAFRIDGPDSEADHADLIASQDYIRQEWLHGDQEFTTHLLQIDGKLRRAITLSYWMQHGLAIRGRDPVWLHRRCRSKHLPLFESILAGIGFEGLCCVNYKERNGEPVLMEINPRFGFSLAPFFSALVSDLDWLPRKLGHGAGLQTES